jgi:hypothetical protein
MRLCANENILEDCIRRLRQDGHDVWWIRETSPGISDDAVLARAATESRLLLTFDKDFGELVFRRAAQRHPRAWCCFASRNLRRRPWPSAWPRRWGRGMTGPAISVSWKSSPSA